MGNDDIDIETDKLSSQLGEPFAPSLGITLLNDDVSALDISQVSQALSEYGEPRLEEFGRAPGEKTYPEELLCRLRVGRVSGCG
jgi:hypothetical protein